MEAPVPSVKFTAPITWGCDGGFAVEGRRWKLAQVRGDKLVRFAESLAVKQVPVYLPMAQANASGFKIRTRLPRPAFPGYCFLGHDDDRLPPPCPDGLLKLHDLKYQQGAIDDLVHLQSLVETHQTVWLGWNPIVGTEVEVIAGPYCGSRTAVDRVSGNRWVTCTLYTFGATTTVMIPACNLKPVG